MDSSALGSKSGEDELTSESYIASTEFETNSTKAVTEVETEESTRPLPPGCLRALK